MKRPNSVDPKYWEPVNRAVLGGDRFKVYDYVNDLEKYINLQAEALRAADNVASNLESIERTHRHLVAPNYVYAYYRHRNQV